MKHLRWFITLLCLTVAITACLAEDATTGVPAAAPEAPAVAPVSLPQPAATDVVQMAGPSAKIDWSIFQFRAVGIGVAPDGATGGKALAQAREAAVVAAERNLLKIIQGVHLTSETTVENLMLKSDVITTNVEGTLKGAMVVSEKDLENGSYQVVVALPDVGKQSVAMALDLPEQVKTDTPASEVAPADLPAPSAVTGDFSSLLIDCRGLKLSPAMTPAILDKDGEAIYPRVNVAAEDIVNRGVVAYYKSVDAAKQAGRVGAHPLIIKASGVQKDAGALWYTSPIVSQANAARILAEDARGGFLGKLAVGFLVD